MGYSAVEVALAAAIGATVLVGAAAMLETGHTTQMTMAQQVKTRGALDKLRDALRAIVQQSSMDRIRFVDLSDGNTAITVDHVLQHSSGSPVWGVEFKTAGTRLQTSRAFSFADAAAHLPVAATADDMDYVNSLEFTAPLEGWKFHYFTATIPTTDRGPVTFLLRSMVNPVGEVEMTELITDAIVPSDATTKGWHFSRAGDGVRIQVNLKVLIGRVFRKVGVDFHVLPKN